MFSNIVRSGLTDSDDHQKRRAVVFSNIISLILSLSVSILYLNRLIFYPEGKNEFSADILLLCVTVFTLPIVLNRLSFTNLGRLALCYLPNVLTWFIFIRQMACIEIVDISLYDTLRIFLLALSPIPYLIFERQNVWKFLLAVAPYLFSFIFFEHILEWFEVGVHQRGIISDDYLLMPLRTFVAYVVISTACFSFQTILFQYDIYNQKILQELQLKSEKIEAQNQELEHLVEKKTEAIQRQNEKILAYTHSNAHHVRASVARILGLVIVSKLETDKDYEWFFDKIAKETQDLNEITKKISYELNAEDFKKLIDSPSET